MRAPLAALVAVVALAVAACGGDDGDGGGEQQVGTRVPSLSGEARQAKRASPRWVRVAVLSGRGDAEARPVDITEDAIQWRVRWTCDEGEIEVAADPGTPGDEPLVSDRCPGRGDAEAVQPGRHELTVRTAGAWRLVVEKQIDAPIDEPPLREMNASAAEVLAEGSFYGIDKEGRGKALLYRLPSGRLALRFEDFEVPINVDLFVWASTAEEPKTSEEAVRAPYDVVAELKSTSGPQNYLVPRGVDAERIRSLVIWCEPQRFAYAAVALRRS